MSEITYTTRDGSQIVLDKGGEKLKSNTYGFEIEFCTHDCSTFAFTHVQVGNILIKFVDEEINWKIETDSGNVFEVVTTPIKFETPEKAYEAKKMLTEFLTSSVTRSPKPEKAVDAVTFKEWRSFVEEKLPKIAEAIYGKQTPTVEVQLASVNAIAEELTMENLDDGINIKAARLRLEKNSEDWPAYVNATTVGRSEKDWRDGYSSQVNMPMTLAGYFLYFVKRKLPAVDLLRTKQDVDVETLTYTKLEQRVENWFWRNVIAQVCDGFMRDLWNDGETDTHIPQINPDFYNLDNLEADVLDLEDLKWYAFVCLVTNKILTGALGSMSEDNQLKLQNVAWKLESTMGMSTDSPKSYQDLLASEQIDDFEYWRDWLDYHSHLKDLTGLWFKAALEDVAGKEKFSSERLTALQKVLTSQRRTIWKYALSNCLKDLQEKKDKEEKIKALDTNYARDLEWDINSDRGKVLDAIDRVQQELAGKISSFASAEPFQLPAKREFLHYSEAPPWEGRYDTMWSAFSYTDGSEKKTVTTYLVEHRFN